MKQRTFRQSVATTGIATHSGQSVRLVLRPAPENTGIVFRRSDLSPVVSIPARFDRVGETTLSTTITQDGVSVSTIEHVMSAFAGLGIDNAFVEVSGAEVPIMDGSSNPFVLLIRSVGIREQSLPKSVIRIKRKIVVKDKDKWASLEPARRFSLRFAIEFNHPAFLPSHNEMEFRFSSQAYVREISCARTFGFLRDLDRLRTKNLAKGASLSNAVAFDDYRVLNEGGLRYPNECVRHKILDAIGDLSLFGGLILGKFQGHKSGHAVNIALLRELAKTEDAWERVILEEPEPLSTIYPGTFLTPEVGRG